MPFRVWTFRGAAGGTNSGLEVFRAWTRAARDGCAGRALPLRRLRVLRHQRNKASAAPGALQAAPATAGTPVVDL